MKDALRRIYEKEINPMTEIDAGVFNETWNVFNRATDKGFGAKGSGDPEYDFYQQLRYNNAVFSAFKVHRLQNDVAAKLLDENGKLKSFERFSTDVQPIVDHQSRVWLRTEYDTAILRAHQAAEWVQAGRVKDVLPNLRWMPTTSAVPDDMHKVYWSARLTLPQEHPFWRTHRPGDRWNCKCGLEATDDPVTGEQVIKVEHYKPDKGLDNNPGEDAKLFSDSHPYIKDAYKGAKQAVEKAVDKLMKKQDEPSVYVIDGITQVPVMNGNNANLNKIVADIERDIRMNKSFETAVAVDHKGKILFNKRGQKTKVVFSSHELSLMKDSILTHNHPRGWEYNDGQLGRIGNSFSFEDYKTAIVCNVSEIRAVTPNYTFVLQRPEKGWNVSPEEFKRVYEDEDRKLKNEFTKRINNDTLTRSQANATHYHILSKRISKKYKWEYVKKKTR